jgi:glycosyltransferase involved in cell wall biosynthesis
VTFKFPCIESKENMKEMTAAVPNALYVGLALHYDYPTRFGMYIHDGFWSWDFHAEQHFDTDDSDSDTESGRDNVPLQGALDPDSLHASIVNFVRSYEIENNCKILMAGLVNCNDVMKLRQLAVLLWKELDIIPCIISATGRSLDEKACSVARKTSQLLFPGPIPGIARLSVGYRHEVEVDGNGKIVIADLDLYKKATTQGTWDKILIAAQKWREEGKKIIFFNSTPQGGGVAIIRHSTIRLFHLLGVDAHWFVMKPNPVIFEITKRKFHNVLQGVAPSNVHLEDRDKKRWKRWCKRNLETYWKNGPVPDASIIVIDDPQPSGMIPFLRKMNKDATLVYRSHIELRSDLIRQEGTEQHHVWNFLWENIQLVDKFVTHPVDSFIPDNVRESKLEIIRMPAITDPVDGLNKPLNDHAIAYHHLIFNRMSFDQTGKKLNFDRPYFIQVARFDPSKGIPDLISAYVKYRLMIRVPEDAEQESLHDATCRKRNIPQLVITGHGSIDDPEGSVIYEEISRLLTEMSDSSDDYIADIAKDVIHVRLGPSDQMLNALLSCSLVAFQLSHREGFEVKITEALLKGVPVVAYRAGGIPLQIQHEVDGLLLTVGDITGVAQAMYKLTNDVHYRARICENATSLTQEFAREWLMTPMNVLHWLSGECPRKPPF